MTSMSELIRLRNFFIVLSCCSYAQKRSQYVLLKVACKKEEYMVLLNIMSFDISKWSNIMQPLPPLLSFSSYHLGYEANSPTYEKLI
jgi:hypothetical protein